jgi:hypothetical protein
MKSLTAQSVLLAKKWDATGIFQRELFRRVRGQTGISRDDHA